MKIQVSGHKIIEQKKNFYQFLIKQNDYKVF